MAGREDFTLGSPGFSIGAAIGLAAPRAVEGLLGEDVVDLLRHLDPALAGPSAMRDVATRALDPVAVLADRRTRRLILEALPREKARELVRRTGVPVGQDAIAALLDERTGLDASDRARAALFEFFGLDEDAAPRAGTAPNSVIRPGYPLFEHQHRATVEVMASLADPPHRCMLHMPTGSGKTRTAMHVVARHLNATRDGLVCWLASGRELLEQAADEFEASWPHLGSRPVELMRHWGDADATPIPSGPTMLVAGFAKVTALLARDPGAILRLADANVLTVVDEAHQAIAPTYRDAVELLTRKRAGTALLGLSATPGRTWADVVEDEKLSAFFGARKVRLVADGYTDPVAYLVDQGYLARPAFRTLTGARGLELEPAEVDELRSGTDVPESVLGKVAEDRRRNLDIMAEVEALVRRHARTILFAATVRHAKLLAAVMSARGLTAFAVDGAMPWSDRQRVIRRFRGADPTPMVMCNFGVLTTGFDAPRTSAVVIARPTRSLVLYSQMVGRAIRGPRAGGNGSAEIVTVVDPSLPGFGDLSEAFMNWEDVWDGRR